MIKALYTIKERWKATKGVLAARQIKFLHIKESKHKMKMLEMSETPDLQEVVSMSRKQVILDFITREVNMRRKRKSDPTTRMIIR